LLESDFDLFHELVEKYTKMSPEAAAKYILDSQLSKVYHKLCCRSMFLGDPYEYRQKMALYDRSKINEPVRF
jgi:hypothetical protein